MMEMRVWRRLRSVEEEKDEGMMEHWWLRKSAGNGQDGNWSSRALEDAHMCLGRNKS